MCIRSMLLLETLKVLQTIRYQKKLVSQSLHLLIGKMGEVYLR
uniref:Uncharacterized protein n=1 Tax=Myoviridae sp. ct3mI7 TaxID=2825028 RepID=A0A8S5QHS2_9CAUD|nr:MAG TPA: hypothetical protein [Myoviridae sp. ct3mI7]DAV21837.1 MAG TPA: hypothetical protein [Caudoviricetes sp.]